MGEIKKCFGEYQNEQGRCSGCPIALLCIDATIAADAYWDSLAERQEDVEAMELDSRWTGGN